ncbi:Membrane dipeptidase (Peptidase family M19) [Hartmannibacter diazotrophicus]|uniref:Membrane dipeptidase (Peptidase family M19) n=1 Tax=Hartmannibacter diazotrophicus TaxID=1482074 RepID=A0A2C9DDW6_9HYPH|nr:dipeptidase [Hartmannibacter diazotrophicus]SON58298.1 Membrane dipeptidase (Peptidase family M19) [Hartmannibacter diazotrophicus]
MAESFPVAVFDGHNDTLLRLIEKMTNDPVADFIRGDGLGHIDLPRARKGGLAGGFFACFSPSPRSGSGFADGMSGASYDVPLPPRLDEAVARRYVARMISLLARIERHSEGALRVCRSGREVRAAIAEGVFAVLLHIEGAEAIDPELAMLDVLHAAGLRSLGPVWSRPTIFGEGVPFRFPATPDIGGGLTEAGKALVKRCNELGILVDLSHLNAAGFDDVASLTDAPLVATHSNAHALCPHARNLTDAQLAAIGASKGMVGLNFATAFLREDGQMDRRTPLETMLRHLDHLVEKAGEDCVGLGSDFDGAEIPQEIRDVAGLPHLVAAMRAHGYGEPLIRKICLENWLGVIDRTLKD